MKLTKEEKAANRESFRHMNLLGKVDYLYEYYKLPILVIAVAIFVACNFLYREITRKEPVLYLGMANVEVGLDMEHILTTDFMAAEDINQKKNEMKVFYDMYLSADPAPENHEYAYTSRLKLLACVDAKQMDVVLMNKEAYDLLSGSEYLLDLSDIPTDGLPPFTENEVVLEDNSIDVTLNTTDELRYVTETHTNGMDLSQIPRIRDAGFSGKVYAGIIANTPRLDTSLAYLRYLASDTEAAQ
ncbi:MAG: hypothetical protein MJ116_02985 [Lachnospiraceae bacterium]|nr:hypothetical protein [Lachnospiraceae bacterium]